MNFKHAEILININQYKNITKTAEILGIKQPTVTFHMKNLEKEMGITLFFHTSGKVLLTDAGIALLDYAKKILLLSKDAESTMKSFSLNEKRTFKIGASMIPSKYILPEKLKDIKKEYPKLPISLTTLSAPSICSMVENFDLDLGIVATSIPNKNDSLKYIPILENKLVLAYSTASNLALLKNITFKDIESENFIMHNKNSTTGLLTEKWMKSNNINIEPYLEIGSTEVIKEMISENIGISLLPYLAIKDYIKNNKISYTDALNKDLNSNIYIVYNKNRYTLPIIKDFISLFNII